MALTIRPTGLGSGIDKDRQDFTIFSGGWAVGRIYDPWRSRPPALVLVADRCPSDGALGQGGDAGRRQAAVPEEWDAWKTWAELQEVP
jgi:hypothetical protein